MSKTLVLTQAKTYFKDIKEICELPIRGNYRIFCIKKLSNVICCVFDTCYKDQDIDNIVDNFSTITEIVNKTSPKNIDHNILTIRNLCKRNLEYLDEFL